MLSSFKIHFTVAIILFIVLIILNISLGSVSIPLEDIMSILFTGKTPKESWKTILLNYRLPKTITATLVGSSLSICGLLMQTLFRNALAGPFVLGISSGSSLGVAFLVLGSTVLGIDSLNSSSFSIAIASSIGAFMVLSVIIITANKVKNTMSILIIGLMFGTFSSAIISILSFFSTAEKLQQFIFWNFGSLGNLSWNKIHIFLSLYLICIVGLIAIIKPLNGLLLGEVYAKSIGLNLTKTRNIIFLITSILTGVATAFCGPIAFIGLAVPHITKLIFKTSHHKTLLLATSLIGAIILLICDIIAGIPTHEMTLPINAVTSLFGAPIVIWLLIQRNK